MRILVTGAGGYIGVPLCARLLESGHEVVGLDRFFFGEQKARELQSNPRFRAVRDDLRFFDLEELSDVDAVMDLAGLSNDASAEIDPSLTVDINARGAIRLAEAAKARGVRRYLYSSSASVYGTGGAEPSTEATALDPQTEYARSKAAVEEALGSLHGPDFEVVVFRNATVYGLAPRMRFDLVVNIMTMRAWKDRLIYIMGGGKQWRPLIHVKDVVQAFLLALEADSSKVAGQVFNVGSNDQNYTIEQIAQFVVDVIPNVTIHRIPDDPDRRTYNLDCSRIVEVLGLEPSRRVHEGIVEVKQALERGEILPDDPTCFTLQWYKSIIDWTQRIRELTCRGGVLEVSDS